ncbi:MAG: VTT domain-containing protein [Candidatus Woesearchaeota archaeon]|jgi:membrane protein YqaA with SNARE-associated domain|nr:VTT domain-containing protein [Candidatus Woesearchaeota archaeon]
MSKKKNIFYDKDLMFSYDFNRKLFLNFAYFFGFILFVSFILYYVFSIRISNNLFSIIVNGFFSHIYLQLKSTTFLGAFYTTLFGGLFFVFVPLEIIFVAFLRAEHNPISIILLFILGLVISYSINYEIGMRLGNISKKIISIKKFYKIKSMVNRYGVYAIFVFNVLPLPSQPLSTILGVFKYSRNKFYIFFILGQLIKFSMITLGYIYIS